jgi:hypothetical protein
MGLRDLEVPSPRFQFSNFSVPAWVLGTVLSARGKGRHLRQKGISLRPNFRDMHETHEENLAGCRGAHL